MMASLAFLLLGLLSGLVLGYCLAMGVHRRAATQQQGAVVASFKALSAEALQHNNAQFLELARSVLAREQLAAADALKPFHDSLQQLQNHQHEMEKTRVGAYEGLSRHLSGLVEVQQQLRHETAQLKQALRRPEGRGRWGEMQLRRLLEMAGMLEHCDFVEQATHSSEGGVQRPDVVVHLPGNRQMVIDCKTPLDALLDSVEAADEAAAAAQRTRHARQMREHVKKLSTKAYWQQFSPSPDFVVLFVPGEHFLSIALMQEPDLFDAAFSQRVILASPINLIALLKTIAHGWGQEKLAEHAGQIAEMGKELYEALASLAAPLASMGDSLRKSVEHYNKTASLFETKALTRARRLHDQFSLASDKEVPTPTPIEAIPRPLAVAPKEG